MRAGDLSGAGPRIATVAELVAGDLGKMRMQREATARERGIERGEGYRGVGHVIDLDRMPWCPAHMSVRQAHSRERGHLLWNPDSFRLVQRMLSYESEPCSQINGLEFIRRLQADRLDLMPAALADYLLEERHQHLIPDRWLYTGWLFFMDTVFTDNQDNFVTYISWVDGRVYRGFWNLRSHPFASRQRAVVRVSAWPLA